MTYRLNRPCLMDIDMPGRRCQNALMGTEHGADNGKIGLCAAHKEMYLHIRAAARRTNLLPGPGAERIFSVPCRL